MRAIRLAGLALVIWVISTEVRPGLHGRHLLVWLLVAALIPAWVAWSTGPEQARVLRIAVFCWLAAVGGVLSGYAVAGLAAVGSAALGAATSFELLTAVAISAFGPAALGIMVVASGRPAAVLLAGAAAALAGMVVGIGRRDSAERARGEMRVAVEHERAELEHARADVLAERNRLAREVHDVLAHTLGALLVQLEALDARLDGTADEAGGGTETIRAGLRRTRALAADGLADARSAVRALRENALPLQAELEKLCELRGARLSVSGNSREPSPQAALALFRVAQESLTNASKHAPGATVNVRLGYELATISLEVENGASADAPSALAQTGGGCGLDGIRERVRLLGGDVAAGPLRAGWRVQARLPA